LIREASGAKKEVTKKGGIRLQNGLDMSSTARTIARNNSFHTASKESRLISKEGTRTKEGRKNSAPPSLPCAKTPDSCDEIAGQR